jgi:four helix bundle protein
MNGLAFVHRFVVPRSQSPVTLVEGNARSGEKDYLRFLNIALGSACEAKYLASLTSELGYARAAEWTALIKDSDSVVRQLQRLVQQMEQSIAEQETDGKG